MENVHVRILFENINYSGPGLSFIEQSLSEIIIIMSLD